MIRPTWKDFLIDSLGPAGGGLIISDISLVLLEFWWITYPIHVLFCKLIQIDWLDDFIFQCVNPLIKATCVLTNNSTYHNINVKQKQKAKHLLLNTTHTTNKRRYEIQVSVHNSLLVFPVLTFPLLLLFISQKFRSAHFFILSFLLASSLHLLLPWDLFLHILAHWSSPPPFTFPFLSPPPLLLLPLPSSTLSCLYCAVFQELSRAPPPAHRWNKIMISFLSCLLPSYLVRVTSSLSEASTMSLIHGTHLYSLLTTGILVISSASSPETTMTNPAQARARPPSLRLSRKMS